MIKKIIRKLLYYISISALFIIVKIAEITPFCVLYRISSLWAKALVKVKKAEANKVTQRNLRRAYRHLSPEEVRQLTQRYYECFLDYLIEFVKQTRFTEEEMMRHCKFKNLDLIEKKFQDHKFVLCYAGHMLNFEWLVSFPLSMKGYGMFHLYQAGEKNKMLDWVLRTRSRFGAVNIPTSSPIRQLLAEQRKLEQGKSEYKGVVFGTLADMDTNEEHPYTTRMFGHDFELMTGSERIGRKMNMGFVYAHISRPTRGYYEIELIDMNPSDLATNPHAYTDEFVRLLEQNINEKPELWMQWGECRF